MQFSCIFFYFWPFRFFNQLLLGSPLYNLMLAIYYLLIGKYNKSDEDIVKYEKYMHIIANTIAISIAVAGLPLTLYNNANLWCWIAAYPEGSEGFNGHENGDIECKRGHGAWMYRWIFFYAPLWAIIVAITFIMILLTQSIRLEEKHYIELMRCEDYPSNSNINNNNSPDSNLRPTEGVEESTETKSSRQSNIRRPIPEERAIGNEESATTNASSSSNYIRPAPPPQEFKLERSRKMFYQALFYVGAFYLTWWAPTINRLIQMANGESYYFFMLATAVFAPLQGFFNFIVYRHGTCIA